LAARTGKGFGAAGKTGSFFFLRKEKAFFLRGGNREVSGRRSKEFFASMRMRLKPLNRNWMAPGNRRLFRNGAPCAAAFCGPSPVRSARSVDGRAPRPAFASVLHRGLGSILQKNHKYSAICG